MDEIYNLIDYKYSGVSMSGITKVSDKMRKKISFGDYQIHPLPEQKKEEATARRFYVLAREDIAKLHAIFSQRLHTANATSISEIMSEAIGLLHKLEKPTNL